MADLEGWSQEKEATQEIQNMCDEIRSDAEKAVGKALGAFTAKKFIKKAGPGPDYIIKVHVGADEYIHVKMCQCDGGKLKFSGHQHPKTKADRLEFILCIIKH